MRRRTFCSLAAALALALVAAGCGGGGGDAQLGRQVAPSTTQPSTKGDTGVAKQAGAYVAQAIVPQLAVYNAPGDPAPSEQPLDERDTKIPRPNVSVNGKDVEKPEETEEKKRAA